MNADHDQELLTMPDPEERGWVEGAGLPVLWSKKDDKNQVWAVATHAGPGFTVLRSGSLIATLPTIGLALMIAEHQMLIVSFTYAIKKQPAGNLRTLHRLYELRQEFDQLAITYLMGVHEIDTRLNP